MKRIFEINGKIVELDEEDAVAFLVSIGCDEAVVREMMAIEDGDDGCMVNVALDTDRAAGVD